MMLVVAGVIPGKGYQQHWGSKHYLNAPSFARDVKWGAQQLEVFVHIKNPQVGKVVHSPSLRHHLQ